MSPVALGVDLATSSARCVAIDAESGTVVARAREELPAPERRGGGVSRQSSEYAPVALRLVAEVCRALGAATRHIIALSVTGTSGTVVPCDQQGRAVGAARLYDDTSGVGALDRAGVAGSSTLGRMLALQREYAPALYASSADVVAAALVGGPVPSDTSHTLKAGIDLGARTWPVDVMRQLGLRTDLLPDLVPPGTPVQRVASGVAHALGLPDGVMVVAGMTDGCTAQLAAGAVGDGDTMGVLGTTLVLKAVGGRQVETEDGAIYSHLAPDGRFWAGGASNSGAGVLATEFAGQDLAQLDARVGERPSTQVRYPLSRPGERFPVADDRLPSLSTGRGPSELDAYRAVLDGVAFVERLGLETLTALSGPSARHVITGGATASPVWNRIRATVLAPLVAVEVAPTASSSIGAAVLAAHAASSPHEPLSETVDRLVPAAAALAPDPRQQVALADAYETFLDLLATRGWSPPLRRLATHHVREGAPHV